jgi:hypothetical protein
MLVREENRMTKATMLRIVFLVVALAAFWVAAGAPYGGK